MIEQPELIPNAPSARRDDPSPKSEIVVKEASPVRTDYESVDPCQMPRNLMEVVTLAKIMAASGLFPDARTAAQANGLMILGMQFGLTPAQSLAGGISVVKGKPQLHYSVIAAKVRQHPDYDFQVIENTDERCVLRFVHRGKPVGDSVFTMADARKMGTQNLDKFPATMLYARAMSQGVRRFAPDVLNGMSVYVAGEVPEDAGPAESRTATLRARLAEESVVEAEVTE
ncbi:MAG: hypothetical protein KIS66_16690 [Fimbriimonadaceae bacterium]|nr:hypothetical protein [Fimbriimonadaceae bacterium]